mmetsp:Transcript_14885/g.27642  ORF Transcript_14885/g.27642 Transcript_14885/m.27642 type:complete len:241 (-) Transcript_14885:160-882(-)
MMLSSSSVHFPFFTEGSRWLKYLSRHCFPILPGSWRAMELHLTFSAAPLASTIILSLASSSLVQGPFLMPGFKTLIHLLKQCNLVLTPMSPLSNLVMRVQSSPCVSTRLLSLLSSSLVHFFLGAVLPEEPFAKSLRALIADPIDVDQSSSMTTPAFAFSMSLAFPPRSGLTSCISGTSQGTTVSSARWPSPSAPVSSPTNPASDMPRPMSMSLGENTFMSNSLPEELKLPGVDSKVTLTG